MKDILFKIKKNAVADLKLWARKFKRFFYQTSMNIEGSFHIPIVINNRNRLTYLKDLVTWLEQAGYTNLYILDNDSTYPPLLDYYKNTPAKVVYLKKNAGYKAMWETELFNEIKKGYYVYTDPDLLPNVACPKDIVYKLYSKLRSYNVEKSGPALKIDDLPDHYAHKEKVLRIEKVFWQHQLEKDVFLAPIDTTFALYKPFAFGDAEECKALRVGGDLVFIHRPWYENSDNLDAETKYYKENVTSSSYWYTK